MSRPDPGADGRRVLFLSYDGLTDPLGRSQVLPYLLGLSTRGHRIAVVSFEKPGRPRHDCETVRAACTGAGIDWHPQRYHARPPVLSTVIDVRRMNAVAARLHKAEPFDIVHCRSYIPSLVGLRLKRRHKVRFLFDMRGFYVDERIEMGLWSPRSLLFRQVIRFFRNREAEFFREADAIVSLTNAAVPELENRSGAGVSVIPCCVDFDQFALPSTRARAEARRELGLDITTPVLGYLGSVGSNYLLDEMFQLFLSFRAVRAGAKFLFLTPDSPDVLLVTAARHGVGADEMIIRSVSRDDVARLMPAADAGVSFIRTGKSKLACCPTKLGEMMALGIPLFVNRGIGDVDKVIEDAQGGVVVDAFDDESLHRSVTALQALPSSAEHIRSEARQRFDLRDGVAAYDSIYRSISP